MKELLEIAEEKGFDYSPIKAETWLLATKNGETENYIILCLVQKWLREEYGIHVEVIKEGVSSYKFEVWDDEGMDFQYRGYDKTYEEALKKGLEEGLKLT